MEEVKLTVTAIEEASKIAENLNARFEILLSNAVTTLNERISEDEMKTMKKVLNIIFG